MAPYDVLGSIAHVMMLESVGLLEKEEKDALVKELREIRKQIDNSQFTIDNHVEDIHSQVELLLTQKLGDVGKKIHSARSRNDQVLVDIKLFLRSELEELVKNIQPLFELLQSQSEKYKEHLLPGYTHLQLAMPSSFGLWFGAYAESLVDDTITIKAAYDVTNKNPLGSAAGADDGEVELLVGPLDVADRGVGEGGAIGAPAAVCSAVEDALAPWNAKVLEQYLPPSRILELMGVISA